MKKIAVLVSGSGTILASIIEKRIPVALVIADKQCRGLKIAAEAGIPNHLINRRFFGYEPGVGDKWDRRAFTSIIAKILLTNQIDVVVMAGFMTVFHKVIFEDFDGRILNIHPALLPAFKGDSAVQDALNAGVSKTGTTVHIATEELDDERYILGQVEVPIEPDDTVATLHERIKVQERKLYPDVIWDILNGKINLEQIKEQA